MATVQGSEYLFPVQYKGVQWYAYSYTTDGGTEVAIHKIANSSKQTIEELGSKLSTYKIKGCIQPFDAVGTGEQPDYISERDYVIDALNSPGKGLLVHPTFGALTDIKAVDWSLDESDESIGKGGLTVTFQVSNFDGVIAEDVAEAASLNNTQEIANANANTDLAENLEADTGLLGVYNDLKEAATRVGDAIEEVGEAVQLVEDAVADVTSQIAEIQENIAVLASAPQAFANAVTNVFATINGTVATAVSGFESFRTFFGFGFLTDLELSFGTNAAAAINKNNRTINTSINGLALTSAYQHAANLDLKTLSDIDEIEQILDDQFNLIMENGDKDLSIIPTILDGRDRIRQLFQSRRLVAARVVEVEVPLTSSRTLAYRYYGSDYEADAIADLNDSYGINMSGVVKVFTS